LKKRQSSILFGELSAKVAFNMLCSNPKSIIPYTHKAEVLNFHKPRFGLMDFQARTDRVFTTTDIYDFTFSIAKFIYTFTSRGFDYFYFLKRMPSTERHSVILGMAY